MSVLGLAYSTDNVTWNPLTFDNGATSASWRLVTVTGGTIPASPTLRLRWTNNTTGTTQMRVDDVKLTGTLAGPTINDPDPLALTDFSAMETNPSAAQSFTVAASYLTGDFVATSSTPDFEISATNANDFATSVIITPVSGSVSTTIYVRISAVSAMGAVSGTIDLTSPSATTKSVAVSGNVIPLGTEDCEGVVDGPAQPGTPCDDADACTTGEVWDVNCACVGGTFQDADLDGTCDAEDLCPNDPNKVAPGTCGCGNVEIGTTCNDNDACTENDIYTTCGVCAGTPVADTDGDGTCDAEDQCPNDPSKTASGTCGCGNPEPGTTCDDGNPATVNDVITNACFCQGMAPVIYWNFTSATATTSTIPNTSTVDFHRVNNNGTTNALITTTSGSSGYAGASGTGNAGLAAFTGSLDMISSSYFEFQLSVLSGYITTVTEITFGSRSTGSGPVAFSLFSDIDGYTTPIATGSFSNNSVWALKTIAGLDLDVVGTKVFRLYGHSGSGGASVNTTNWRIDDLNIHGTNAAAPACEPVVITGVTTNSPICADELLELGVTVSGTAPFLYEWTGVGEFAGEDEAEALVEGAASGNYHIVVINDCGDAEQDVAVTVNPLTTWYADMDGDGFGDPELSVSACEAPAGYVSDNSDLCPTDGDKQSPGACGCGFLETDTDNDGIADCIDPCPALPNLSNGDACNDGDPTTGNDIVVDCVCVGQPLDCENVPGGNALPGTPCDDGSATTGNDTWSNECVCEGLLLDCENVAGGSALPGTPCDDDDDSTGNDTWGNNCVCAGEPLDCLNVPGGSALPGTPCNDGDPGTGNDTWSNECTCIGLPYDCENVPGGSAQPGTPCDDGDVDTENDMWTANCTCLGQPILVCNGTSIQVRIHTDNNGYQTSWTLYDNNTASEIASGGPYTGQNNTLIIDTVCVPPALVSQLQFRLEDSGGDGLGAGGYWEVVTMDGRVALRDNFSGSGDGANSPSSTPAAPSYGDSHTIMLPLGPADIDAVSCGVMNNLRQAKVFAVEVPGASSYQFEFSDPDAGFIRRIAVPRNWVRFSEMVTLPLVNGVPYFARVRVDQGAVGFGDDHFGGGCELGLVADVRCTGLVDDLALPSHSCGVNRLFGTSQKVWAYAVSGATQYRFRFSDPASGFVRTIVSTSYALTLNWQTLPLVNGVTYDVSVEVFAAGSWSGYCGPTCQVSIGQLPPTMTIASGHEMEAAQEMTLWPNPSNGERVSMLVTGLDQAITVDVRILDIHGREVMSTLEAVVDGTVRADLPAGDLANGTYLVRVRNNDSTLTGRFVIQR